MSVYYKVVNHLDTNLIPGLCTNQTEHTKSDIAAAFDYKNPDQIVYVVEFDIDTSRLVFIETPVTSIDTEILSLPGCYGPANPDDDFHPTQHSLDLIMWNEPVQYRLVGAYISGLSIDPLNRDNKHYFLEDSNFSLDSERGFWSTRDMNLHISPESRARFLNVLG